MSNKEDSCEGEHFNTRSMKDYVVEFSIPKSDTFETVVLSVSGSRLIVRKHFLQAFGSCFHS